MGLPGLKMMHFLMIKSGTVFLSWNIRDKIIKTKRYRLRGRNDVINASVFVALSMCLNYVKNEMRKDN